MSPWRPSRWFSSRQPREEQDRQTFLLDQRPQGQGERPTASNYPVAANAASQLSIPMPFPSTGPASGIARVLQADSQHEYDVLPGFLAECMGNPDILEQDLQYVDNEYQDVVPEPEQARAGQIVNNSEFLRWLNSHESEHLLVHGRYNQTSYISGLSMFCRSLMRALKDHGPRFIPLVFFCGMHTRQSGFARPAPPSYHDTQQSSHADIEPPDYYEDARPPTYDNVELPCTGGLALIQSLIYQLLRYLPDQPIPMTALGLMDIQTGDFSALYELFSRLLGMVPRDVVVCCLVDGVEYYEQGEVWDTAKWILGQLILLSSPRNTGPPFHLLITTPTFTSHIWDWFPPPRILSLDTTGWDDVEADSGSLRNALYDAVEQGRQYPDSPCPVYSGFWSWE